MGCGASKAEDDPFAVKRGPSSSVATKQIAVKDREKSRVTRANTTDDGDEVDDNPFLDPVNDGSRDRPVAHKKVAREEEKEETVVADESEEEAEKVEKMSPKSKSRLATRRSSAAQPEEKEADAAKTALVPSPAKDSPLNKTRELTKTQSFTAASDSPPPSYDLSQPGTLDKQLGTVFLHYAQKKYDTHHQTGNHHQDVDLDEEKIDKKALQQLAHDCVLAFVASLKKEMLKVREDKRMEEENYQRKKLVPGDNLDETMDIAREYLKAELVYKNGHVTRTCFFFHFPRAFRALFTYEKMTLERENLVTKWNKIGKETLAAHKDKEKEREGKKEKEKDRKEKEKKKKKRQTAPAAAQGDLFANMAGHGSKLMQAEKKLQSAAKAQGSQRNLLAKVEHDDDDDD